jgi:DNA/RNA endonuclease YhcR with UshA esterase domain
VKNRFMSIALMLLALASTALILSLPALAHHSSAAFDLQHPVTVKGKVTQFEWANPHAFIYLDVKNDKGGIDQWRVEANSPNMLSRVGWNREIIKPGDEISVTGAPAKNGTTVMRLDNVVLPDGKKMDGQGFNYGH